MGDAEVEVWAYKFDKLILLSVSQLQSVPISLIKSWVYEDKNGNSDISNYIIRVYWSSWASNVKCGCKFVSVSFLKDSYERPLRGIVFRDSR